MSSAAASASIHRFAGLVPLALFAWRVVQYSAMGKPEGMMWNCHVANLVLAAGLCLAIPRVIRIAAIWLVIGVPLWLIDAWVTSELWISSIASHVGGCVVALWSIQKIRWVGSNWPWALLYFAALQLVTRWITTPEHNINVAHTPYPIVASWFDSYWPFWLFALGVVGFTLWCVERWLAWRYPPDLA